MKNLFENLLALFLLTMTIGVSASAQKKTIRKTLPKPPVQKTTAPINPATGMDTTTGTLFTMTVERGDKKTQISSDQFEERDGNTIAAGDSRLLLFYGAADKAHANRFSFNAAIPKLAKGVYPITDIDLNPGFSITSSALSNAGAVKAKSGMIEITAYPSGAGFVEGKFSGVCEVKNDDGTTETFNISGSFRLRKRLA